MTDGRLGDCIGDFNIGPEMATISIITVCRNSIPVIRTCLESVATQTHSSVEHIVIDGASTDGTQDVVNSYPHVKTLVSERDSGLYDAMNKGIALASGDIVGTLNADDFYPTADVLNKVATAFQAEDVAATIGDVAFVAADNLSRITRYCSARHWNPRKFADGLMPPHPAFFVRRKHYATLGGYRTDLHISSDFDLLIRFLYTARLPFHYIPGALVHMRSGGTSNASWRQRWVLQQETLRACRDNGIHTTHARLALRYVRKLREFLPLAWG